jgi:hypothetical protein
MGEVDWHLFAKILGLLCFCFETRLAVMTVKGACKALDPLLEQFEAEVVLEWGRRKGVFVEVSNGDGTSKAYRLSEWWWLLVPILGR